MAPVISPITPPHTPPKRLLLPERNISKILSFPATMAPPKAAAPKKDKSPMQASKPVAASGSAEPVGALPKSRIGPVGIDKVRYLVGAETNEHGATRMVPAGSHRLGEGYYTIFLHTLFASLVPPFSDFLEAILETYQIQLRSEEPSCRERVYVLV